MKQYVTTDEVRDFLYIEEGQEEKPLQRMIMSAQSQLNHALQYADIDDYEDAEGNLPEDLKEAIMVMVANQYGNRESVTSTASNRIAAVDPATKYMPYVRLVPKKGGAR